MNIPIMIKLLSSLLIIVSLNRITRHLPLSLFLGALGFAFWLGLPSMEILRISYERIFSGTTAGLIALIFLVIALSTQMKKTSLVNELISSIRGIFSARASLAVIPAVIGLLPMPGGALFSAPLLDHFDDLEGIDGKTKTEINYWFRHVWEYAWPLYPGIIVACDIADIALWQIMLFGLPMSIASIIIGYVFFLSKIPKVHESRRSEHTVSIIPFLPVLTVIIIYALIQILLPQIGASNKYLPMVIGLFASITLLQLLRPMDRNGWYEILTSKNIYKMLLIILMVRFFGGFVEAQIDGVSVIEIMAGEMQRFGIPTLPLIMGLPFLAGITMGVSVGFAGAALPVVFAILGANPSFGMLIGTMIFSYVCGFMGTMLSPLHVCMIVTCEYYKRPLGASFRTIIAPAITMAAAAFAYRELLRVLM